MIVVAFDEDGYWAHYAQPNYEYHVPYGAGDYGRLTTGDSVKGESVSASTDGGNNHPSHQRQDDDVTDWNDTQLGLL